MTEPTQPTTTSSTDSGDGSGSHEHGGATSPEPESQMGRPARRKSAAGAAGARLGVPSGAARAMPDPGYHNPSYVFLFLVSAITVALDIATKSWAERHLDTFPGTVEIVHNYLTLVLAKNRGGAWGILQTTSESVRRPFFLLVSAGAIVFIMTLYRRLQPRQRALKWGLPLVLGGALGNVFDRIRYGQVIDFIDAHARWGGQEHHWPTFNVADVAICVGVGLMAVDMFTSKRGNGIVRAPRVPPAQSGEPVPDWSPPTASGGSLTQVLSPRPDGLPPEPEAGASPSPQSRR